MDQNQSSLTLYGLNSNKKKPTKIKIKKLYIYINQRQLNFFISILALSRHVHGRSYQMCTFGHINATFWSRPDVYRLVVRNTSSKNKFKLKLPTFGDKRFKINHIWINQ